MRVLELQVCVALLMPCREAHESLKQQKVSLTGLQPTTALVLTRRSIFGAQSGLKYLELSSDKLSLRLNFQNADGDDCLKSSRKQRAFFISLILPSLEYLEKQRVFLVRKLAEANHNGVMRTYGSAK